MRKFEKSTTMSAAHSPCPADPGWRWGEQDYQQVAVIGDELERHRVAARVGELQLDEARHRGVENAEAILSWQHLEHRRVGEVHQRHIAQEAVGVEAVVEVLPVRIHGVVLYVQDDVEVVVARVEQGCRSATSGIDAVGQLLGTAVTAAVAVDHRRDCLCRHFQR